MTTAIPLDCKGLSCPMPIVKVSKAMKELESGQTLSVEATDPAFIPDIEAWTRKTGHILVHIESGDVQRAIIEKV